MKCTHPWQPLKKKGGKNRSHKTRAAEKAYLIDKKFSVEEAIKSYKQVIKL